MLTAFYIFISVILISLISLVGIAILSVFEKKFGKFLLYFISFAAGAMFGDAFLHLLPEALEKGYTIQISMFIIAGIVVAFFVERIIHWHHCYHSSKEHHEHCEIRHKGVSPIAYMSLFGDFFHNFIDGLIIAGSYLASVPVGIATTLAVVLHEIPQEMGDFAVLMHSGFSKWKALGYNFLVSLSAILGAVVALLIGKSSNELTLFIVPFAAGSFIYIAGSDLIPELNKETNITKSMMQIFFFLIGIFLMIMLLALE